MRRNKGSALVYYLREGISSIFTHGFMSFASVCVIVACLLIMGSFTLLALNVESIIGTMESQNVLMAFIDDSLSEAQARSLQSNIEALDNVESATFVSRDEAMESFVETYESDYSSLFDGLDSTILRHRYVIYVYDIALMSETQEAVHHLPGIASVSAQLEISSGFVTIRKIVTIVSLVLTVILFIVSLFIMSNTVKLTTFERKDEIAIMKMVGATGAFIRWPFVVEGLLLGVVGSMTAYLLQWGVYELLLDGPLSHSGIAILTVLPFSAVALPLLIAFAAVGLGVGVIGSLIAIKNYLKV